MWVVQGRHITTYSIGTKSAMYGLMAHLIDCCMALSTRSFARDDDAVRGLWYMRINMRLQTVREVFGTFLAGWIMTSVANQKYLTFI